MILLIISFVAGILTVLAPCILPLLPVIIGGTASTGNTRHRASVIILSLLVSIVLFTLVLKWSTAFIGVPAYVWTTISGTILILFSFTMIFPGLWERIPFVATLSGKSNMLLGKGYKRSGLAGDIIMGAALGPIFSSCSPTYFVILATVLPQSFAKGLLYLIVYALGLGLALFLISRMGQKITERLGGVSDPKGWFKRGVGILFLLVGIAVLSGYDKKFEAGIIESGFLDVTKIEQQLLKNLPVIKSEMQKPAQILNSDNTPHMTLAEKAKKYAQYIEIVNPAGFVNTNDQAITIGQYVGKKVILVDFLTYSCINCQRTFPYLKTWYETYEKDGFIIIGIHTPEFAFEKDKANVIKAMQGFGLTFPFVLDNSYSTWNAYNNNYWPHKYLIDIDGYVVYDHIGEGAYDETEKLIQDLLVERAVRLGLSVTPGDAMMPKPVAILANSPETYLGSARTEGPYNSAEMCSNGVCTYSGADVLPADEFAYTGAWQESNEYVMMMSDTGSIADHFNASKVYFVAEAGDQPVYATVYLDGVLVPTESRGSDVDAQGRIVFTDARLYSLLNFGDKAEDHTVEIKFTNKGIKAYTFTFG